MEPNRRSVSPEALHGGRLLAFAGDGDRVTLTQQAAALVYGRRPGEASYDDVLEWVVNTVADVIAEKMGPAVDGDVDGTTGYAITLRTPEGDHLPIEDLPTPERYVWQAVVEALEGDARRVHGCLEIVERGSGPGERARALIEAVCLLDRLLDLPALPGTYTVPE